MVEPVHTTCPFCGVGCGIVAEVAADGTLAVRGDPDHPANYGRLCARGASVGEAVGVDHRLLHPTLRGVRVGWDTAVGALAGAFAQTLGEHGPDALAIAVSGQLLTEDHYVVNKLMKGFLGSANIDGNARRCMEAVMVAQRLAYGSDTVPGCFDDLEQADLVVLAGSNLAGHHPVLQQRLVTARRQRRTKVVVIDPCCTPSCDEADIHLQIRPGADAALFAGLLAHLHINGRGSARFLAEYAAGAEEAVAAALAGASTLTEVAAHCGVAASNVRRFYELFAATERVVTVISQGVGSPEAVGAIINAHLYAGRIGRPGMGPLPVVGQANASGGRDVGSLSGQLAAHMGFGADDVERVRRFWNAPRMAANGGLGVEALAQAVEEGRIKALWIIGTDSPFGMRDADHLRAAVAGCEFVAFSGGWMGSPSARAAHLLLPAAQWGESEGTVTASDRTISRRRAWRAPPGEARPDWWIAAAVGRALGWEDAFGYTAPAEVFREHAALSAFENIASRAFDIGALAGLSDDEYALLEPAPWPRRSGGPPLRRLFAGGGFLTDDGRARLVPVAG